MWVFLYSLYYGLVEHSIQNFVVVEQIRTKDVLLCLWSGASLCSVNLEDHQGKYKKT